MKYASPEKFQSLCARVGVSPITIETTSQKLFEKYSEVHRSYHNLNHIEYMLSFFSKSSDKQEPLELAIWFHDVVYEPKESENERRSANLFREQLGPELPTTITSQVIDLILATDPSQPRTGKPQEDLLVDIDLSILGSSPKSYETYRAAIRKEYHFVPEDDFRQGRSKILQSFLSGPIFVTERFKQFEEQARINISAELDLLTSRRAKESA